MAAIRPVDVIAKKWATVTPQRTEDYQGGIENPRKDWKTETAAAAEAWKTGVQAAIAGGRFTKGVNRVGTSAWQAASLEKGVQRWGPGVQLGEDNYAAGFGPYREAILRVQLPPRFARRDPRNLDRVKAITTALAATKEQLAGR
jgi:hypothetical protein